MENKNGYKFIWGNYDYSNDLPKDIITNKENKENKEFNQEEENKNFFIPIKSKIKNGLEKTSELTNKLKEKLTFKNQAETSKINQNKFSDIINNEGNSYESDEDFQIKCNIDEYKDRVIGKDHVIFYKIELSSLLSGKNWEVYRCIKEFSDLYLIYQKLFLDSPKIKWPHVSNIRNEPVLHRQLISQLNSFLYSILIKPGLLTPPFLIEFLELQNHNNDLAIYKPILRYDSNFDEMYSNKLSIKDILFLEEPKLLLIGTGLLEGESLSINNEVNNSKSSLISKLGKLFSSNKDEKNNSCKGKFYIYNLIKNNNLDLMLVELKCLDVISPIEKIDYFSEKNIIILGLNNGQILIFELYIKQQNPNSKDILEYIGTINYHTNIPLCCLFNFKEGYIYSLAKYETNIKICEYNYQNLIKDLNIYNNTYKKSRKNKGFIFVDYTISYEYIYLQDEEGTIFFIDIITDLLNPYIVGYFPKFLKNASDKNKSKIIKIKNSFYLFASENNKDKIILNIYLILINEINNTDESINLIKMKEIYLNGEFFITNIRLSNKFDIIISLSNGSICIYNHSNKTPEYYIIYHHKHLTNFIWLEKEKSIISASLDKSIKIYQIPLKFPAEIIRKNKKINDINIVEDIIEGMKNIYNELECNHMNNEYNNFDEEINNEKEKGISENKDGKKFMENIWDIGNINSYNSEDKNIIDNNKYSFDDNINNNILYSDNNIKIINKNESNHFDNYHQYFNIFSDDLDGWSE